MDLNVTVHGSEQLQHGISYIYAKNKISRLAVMVYTIGVNHNNQSAILFNVLKIQQFILVIQYFMFAFFSVLHFP